MNAHIATLDEDITPVGGDYETVRDYVSRQYAENFAGAPVMVPYRDPIKDLLIAMAGLYRDVFVVEPDFPDCHGKLIREAWLCCRQKCRFFDEPTANPMDVCNTSPTPEEDCFHRCLDESGH